MSSEKNDKINSSENNQYKNEAETTENQRDSLSGGDEDKHQYEDSDQNVTEERMYEDLSREELLELLVEKDNTIQKLNYEVEEQKETALRKTAELDNVKKRTQRERFQHNEEAKIEAIRKFLPLREDLQRTLNAAEGLEIDEKFLEGVQMVADKFESVLEEYGVEPIEEVMVPFDVDLHDAMLRQPAEDDNVDSNTVLQVVETGYKVGEKVIKHAKVIVSQ